MSLKGGVTRKINVLVGSKYILAVLVFILSIPALLFGVLYVESENRIIEFAKKERLGIRALEILVPHALDAMSVNDSNNSSSAKIEDIIAQIRALAGGEHFLDETKWIPTKNVVPVENDRQAFASAIFSIIDNIGDNSNLVLDPDLDSYYLMDAVVITIPGALLSMSHSFDESKEWMPVVTAAAKRIQFDLSKAQGTANAFAAKDIDSLVSKYRTAFGELAERRLSKPTDLNGTVVEESGIDRKAVGDLLETFWPEAIKVLDKLLRLRIEKTQRQVALATLLAVLAWFVGAGMFEVLLRKMQSQSLDLKSSTKFLEQTGALAKVGGWELDLKNGQVHMTKQTQILHEIDEYYVPPKYSNGAEWYPPEVWPTVQAAVQKAIEHGTPYDLEAPFITAKNRRIWVRAQGFPVIENDKVVKLQGTFQDITDRKKSEEFLERAKEDLERERAKTLSNAKLASLGKMSAGIAHEINNPLAIIYGTARVLPKFVNNPEKLALKIETIQSSSERTAKIVRSLRKFSRTSDKSEYKLHSLSDIIREAFVLTDAEARRFSTKVELDCQSECCIICDEIEMEQVLVNLINNAIDAVKILSEKWVRLELKEIGGRVVLRIRDSGPRISHEIQQKLFQPFFTTKPVGEGTGLGLSIVKGILDEHQATIELVADDAHTCFEISFPKAEVKKDAA
jgi:signal transduction histidine kinase